MCSLARNNLRCTRFLTGLIAWKDLYSLHDSSETMEDHATVLTVDDVHSGHVDRTLKELQRMVKEHENALDKVCFRTLSVAS